MASYDIFNNYLKKTDNENIGLAILYGDYWTHVQFYSIIWKMQILY